MTRLVCCHLQGEVKLPDGGVAVPAFVLMAEAYLDDAYAKQWLIKLAFPRGVKQLAADLAEAAFAKQITIKQPWTDWKGERHEEMIGRPVSMHAMRGISAHSNGFQTCRALHVLQLILGSVEVPGGFQFKPPYPNQLCHPKSAGRADQVAPGQPWRGPAGLCFGAGRSDHRWDWAPQRIDKAYSWDAPMSAHGLMLW